MIFNYYQDTPTYPTNAMVGGDNPVSHTFCYIIIILLLMTYICNIKTINPRVLYNNNDIRRSLR